MRTKRYKKQVILKRNAKSGLSINNKLHCTLIYSSVLNGLSYQTIAYVYSITEIKALCMFDKAKGGFRH